MGRWFKVVNPYLQITLTAGAAVTITRWFYGPASQDARFGMVILAIFSASFLGLAIFQEFRYSRKTRYAEAFHNITKAFELCLQTTQGSFPSVREINMLAEKICDQISTAFGIISGSHCAVCIKVLDDVSDNMSKETPRISVGTLCRDTASRKRQLTARKHIHFLDKNTDFLKMFDTLDLPNGGTFIENNLPSKRDYMNTSFEVYGNPKSLRMPILGGIVRNARWPLPYKSTVGSVIYPLEPSADDRLLGFLCIDCRSRGAFKKRYDVGLVRSFSAAIYPMMMNWYDLISNKQSGGEND